MLLQGLYVELADGADLLVSFRSTTESGSGLGMARFMQFHDREMRLSLATLEFAH